MRLKILVLRLSLVLGFSCLSTTALAQPGPSTSFSLIGFLPGTTGGVPVSSTHAQYLGGQTFHPFSDFVRHDMASLGDGITSGPAGPTTIRTAALWGVRAKSRLLHDGRAEDVPTGISLHDGQGKLAAQVFQALSNSDRSDLLNLLGSI